MADSIPDKIPYNVANLEYIVSTYWNDPEGFLRDLLGFTAFDPWQEKLLGLIKAGCKRIAVASCNGSGKSFITSAIEIWWLLTHGDATVSVCSATYAQLYDAHFRLIQYHISHSLISDFFDCSNSSKIRLPDSGDAAYIGAVSNNKTRSEGIAGRHHGSLLTIFDEASGIHGAIYDAQEGNMTTEDATWIVIGNPLLSGTPFHDIFSQPGWETMHIDARICRWTSKEWVDRMIETYGEDDDRVRARVFGQFPRGSVNTVVSLEDYEEAEARQIEADPSTQPVIGFDVSRSGADSSVICTRIGRVLTDITELTCTRDSVTLAHAAADYYRRHKGTILSIDGAGLGGPIADILKRLIGRSAVHEVGWGKAHDKTKYVNHRAELWVKYADWLKNAKIPKHARLKEDSIQPEGWYTPNSKYQVESKEDMKGRGKPSTDFADSVICSLDVDSSRVTLLAGKSNAEDIIERQRRALGGAKWTG